MTQLRCGGIFDNHDIANFPQSMPVKKFLKSVNIWQRYRQKLGGMFLPLGVNALLAAILENGRHSLPGRSF